HLSRLKKEKPMSARKILVVVAALVAHVSLVPPKAVAWGPEGHVIVGRIAELNLSADAKTALAALLPDTGFSNSNSISAFDLVNYADHVKHNSNFPMYNGISAPWHFIDIPVKPSFQGDPIQFCNNGACVIAKIDDFKTVLASKTLPKERRQEALVFLVHLV